MFSDRIRRRLGNGYYNDIDVVYSKDDIVNYRKAVANKEKEFKDDLFDYLDFPQEVTQNQKNKLFELAWEYGHSSGYEEVFSYAVEMSDLLLIK